MSNSKVKNLDVYLFNKYVGKLSQDSNLLKFQYDHNYISSGDAIRLSKSLPLQEESFNHNISNAFFSGLLPDEEVRYKLARYLGLSDKNTFALLKEVGGECSGAVSFYDEGTYSEVITKNDYHVLTDDKAYEVLEGLEKRPLMAGEGDIRISGAGAQNKLVVAFTKDNIVIPAGNSASTHIIKPAIKDLKETVFNEFFCMRLAKELGFNVPETEIYWLKDKAYYLIERYDRFVDELGEVQRLHQEDFCQALGLVPEIKYESEGGPALEDCFKLLDEEIKSGAMAGANKLYLLKAAILNYLIGNGDAHGKNFSVLYQNKGEVLAPLYDLMCTVIYTDAYKSKMAMKIGSKYKFNEINLHQFDRLSDAIGIKPKFARKQISTIVTKIVSTAEELAKKLNKGEKTKSPIYSEILEVISKHSKVLS